MADGCFREAFDGVRSIGDIMIACRFLKENEVISRMDRYVVERERRGC